jgi:hypothetical protein
MIAQRRPFVRSFVALTILASAGLLAASPPRRVRGTRAVGRVAPESDRMLAAKRLISESSGPAEVRFQGGYLRSFIGRVPVEGLTPVARARRFLARNASLYGLDDPAIHLDVRRQARLLGVIDSVTFTEKLRGLPVQGGDLVVNLFNGEVLSTLGGLLHADPGDLRPGLAAQDAEAIARLAVGARGASSIGTTTLFLRDQSLWLDGIARARLAWRVVIGQPVAEVLYVDARSGELLARDPTTQNDSLDDFDLDLEDAENDASAEADDCFWTSDETEVGDEDGIISAYINDPDAVNSWNNIRETYAFYHDTFGRHSWDDDGDTINLYIRALTQDSNGNPAPNAAFVSCPDGSDNIEMWQGFIAYDVMVHEFTHGVISFTSELQAAYPSRSVNEAMSDAMAAMADGDWLMGESLPAAYLNGSPAIRSMSNPPSIGNYPDRYSERTGSNYPDTGIASKAVFLMTDGGQHPDTGVIVNGIGRPKAGMLLYLALQSLPSSATYLDVPGAVVGAGNAYLAIQDFLQQIGLPTVGLTQDDMCQVRNAYGAVELGQVDQDCDGQYEVIDWDKDGIANAFDNCPLVANPDQAADMDSDGVGDLCDPDYLRDDDHDGVLDWQDNCVFYNPKQTDLDGDGVGVPCDTLDSPDADRDGVPNEADNCPLDPNPEQEDIDLDGEGDACDPDGDGDGLSNDNDICPFTFDPSQADGDGDGLGDACDPCPDAADDVTAWTTGIPEIGVDPKPILPDSDGDGTPDACDGTRYGPTFPGQSGSPAGGLDARQAGNSASIRIAGGLAMAAGLPIRLCDFPPCSAPPADLCVGLEIRGAPATLGVGVTDDRGLGLGLARTGSVRTLRFQPDGARGYELTFTGDAGSGANVSIQIVPCGKASGPIPPPVPSFPGPPVPGAPPKKASPEVGR